MEKLEEIKEGYSKRMGYKNWDELVSDKNIELHDILEHCDVVAVEFCQINNSIYANQKLDNAINLLGDYDTSEEKSKILSLKDPI